MSPKKVSRKSERRRKEISEFQAQLRQKFNEEYSTKGIFMKKSDQKSITQKQINNFFSEVHNQNKNQSKSRKSLGLNLNFQQKSRKSFSRLQKRSRTEKNTPRIIQDSKQNLISDLQDSFRKSLSALSTKQGKTKSLSVKQTKTQTNSPRSPRKFEYQKSNYVQPLKLTRVVIQSEEYRQPSLYQQNKQKICHNYYQKETQYKNNYNCDLLIHGSNMIIQPKKSLQESPRKKQAKLISQHLHRYQKVNKAKLTQTAPVKKHSKQKFVYYMSELKKYLQNPYDISYFAVYFREHFKQTISQLYMCKNFGERCYDQILSKTVSLKKRSEHKGHKTIIFDLDETLVHCSEASDFECDVILPIKCRVNIRPYAKEILKQLHKHFEIIVFTASHACYANVILDYLDPDQKYISHRLYRESCVKIKESIQVKDLRIFKGRKIEDIVIVDNAASSFAHQIYNGVPIIPYYDNKKDKQLMYLTQYLKRMIKEDIRTLNKRTFKFQVYTSNNPVPSIIGQQLFPNQSNH